MLDVWAKFYFVSAPHFCDGAIFVPRNTGMRREHIAARSWEAKADQRRPIRSRP